MHKVFGTKEETVYLDREGAYLIPTKGTLVGVVRTPKGYFLLGGGLENGESHISCILREVLEETGYTAQVDRQICSAESYGLHPTLGYFHPIQTYYAGHLLEQVSTPVESDHTFHWVEYARLKGNLFVKMQNWALEQLMEPASNG